MEKHTRFTYLLTFIMLLLVWQVGGGLVMLSFFSFFPGDGMISSFIGVCIPHIVLFFSALFTIKKVLHENIRDERHSFKSYALTGIISFTVIALFQLLHLDEMHPSGHGLLMWLEMLPLVIIITPLQAAAEELLFRYMIHKMTFREKSFKQVLIAGVISGFVFLLFHMAANTEFRTSPSFWLYAYYFLFGFYAMALTAYTDDITYALIIHAANNIFVLTVAGYTSSALQGAPLFITEGVPSPLISSITLTAVFSAVTIYLTGAENAKKEKTE
ncbi:MAG: lysostaphin resistance A-like protein [Bullifex sp.]